MGHSPQHQKDKIFSNAPIPNVKNVIAIASGKGGVGKSTVSVNLAIAFAQKGYKVGVLDCDVFGPSIPHMIHVFEKPDVTPGKQIIPHFKFQVEWMSLGFMLAENAPVIWRGLMVQSAMQQLFFEVAWGTHLNYLDYLFLDLPPGTGDVQLTMAQKILLQGAIIVSTPQDIALIDAKRAAHMFKKVNVPLLGMIENMAYFECSACGHQENIFDYGGAAHQANELSIPFLGHIPLLSMIRKGADEGVPAAFQDEVNKIYGGIIQKIQDI